MSDNATILLALGVTVGGFMLLCIVVVIADLITDLKERK